MKISLLLCCVALVLQILGFACPGWMILSIDLSGLGAPASGLFGFGKITTYAAVWYVRVCTNNGQQETCESSTYHEASFMGLQLSNALSGKTLSEPRYDKTNKVSVRPAKSQISLGICPV